MLEAKEEIQTMSVARALREVALISKRVKSVEGELNKAAIIAVLVGEEGDQQVCFGNQVQKAADTDESKLKSNFQSILSLINYRDALRNAIIVSNATTTIRFQGTDYLIAELIEMRKNLSLYRALSQNARKELIFHRKLWAELEQKFQERVQINAASIPASLSVEESKPLRQAIEDDVAKKMKPVLLDPNKLQSATEQLSDRIDWIESEMELAINESNMNTQIAVKVGIRPLVKVI